MKCSIIFRTLSLEILIVVFLSSTCTKDQFPPDGPCSKPTTEVWTLSASNNNIVKSQKRDKLARADFASSSHYVPTANRFSPLSNLKGAFVEQSKTQKSSECASTQRVHKTTIHRSKGNKIPTIVNGIPDSYREFPSTTYNKEETSNVKCHQAKMWNTQIVKSLHKVKYRVLIIGDSHAMNCVFILQDNLSIDYKVSSFMKPGAQMNEITKTAREELKSLKE